MKRSIALGISGLVLGSGGLAMLLAGSVAAGGDARGDSHAGLSAEKQELAEIERQLADENAALAGDPEALERVVNDKAAEHERHLAELNALGHSDEDWPTGIIDDPEAPAPGASFLGTNRWVGQVDLEFLSIHAGRSGEDPTVGRILAVWSDPSMAGYTVDLADAGSLRVVAATQTILTLQDEHGKLHRLNAVEGTWVS